MGSPDPQHPTALISYSHDSLEHEARVLELANRLRSDGIDCDLDQYVPGGLPPLGWPRWMQGRIEQCDFTIMVCTETYGRRVAHAEPPGIGRGVIWEADLLYQTDDFRARVVPILVDGTSLEDVPLPVRGNRVDLRSTDGYEQLLRRLRGVAAAAKPALGPPSAPSRLASKPSQWSAFRQPWLVPERNRSDYFTGRDDTLTRLRDALTERRRAALNGLGGVGKTQTALEYACRYRAAYPGGAFWVNAENVTVLTTGLVDVAKRLQLSAATADDESAIVEAVLMWFEENADWLFVLDNVDDVGVVKSYMPGRSGHVLVTTRKSALHELGIPTCVDVLEFTPEEAVGFLLARTGRRADDVAETAAVKSLAEELGFLPLALEQAAAFVAENGSRFSVYLASLRKRRLQLLAKSSSLVGGYHETVATTWAANFEAIEQDSPGSADVLRISAFLHPERIPLEIFTSGASELGPPIAAALSNPEDALQLDELLTPLSRYSLIRREPENESYTVHRLVQDVAREYMDEAAQSLWLGRTVAALDAAFPYVGYSNWELCDRLLPHAQAVIDRITDDPPLPLVASRLLNRTAYYLHERGRYAEAQPLYERALAIRERALGPDHPDVATSLNNLAALFRAQGRYAEAQPLYERALAICERALGPDHPNVATTLNNLALLFNDQGRYAEAQPLYERALAIRERALGPDHPDVAITLNNLAGLFNDQGRYAEAQPLYERALAIRERALGPYHPDVANTLNNLAGLFNNLGRSAEAQPLYERALAICERALGPDHPDVATTLNNLASLFNDQGRYAEAQPLYERALAIRERALGPDHPDVATTLNNLALLFNDQGRYAEAQPLYERDLAICERALGPDHPNVATTLNNIAGLFRAQGRYAEAQPLYERALAIRERALGPDHPDVATTLSNIAGLFRAQGRYAEAQPLYERALAIRERALGRDHPDVATTLNNIAGLFRAQGRYAEAQPLYERALAIRGRANT